LFWSARVQAILAVIAAMQRARSTIQVVVSPLTHHPPQQSGSMASQFGRVDAYFVNFWIKTPAVPGASVEYGTDSDV
jgi:hypothetical protein